MLTKLIKKFKEINAGLTDENRGFLEALRMVLYFVSMSISAFILTNRKIDTVAGSIIFAVASFWFYGSLGWYMGELVGLRRMYKTLKGIVVEQQEHISGSCAPLFKVLQTIVENCEHCHELADKTLNSDKEKQGEAEEPKA